MARYLARRFALAVLLVFTVSSAALFLARLAPGDFAIEAFGVNASGATATRERARLGLDQPVLTQYARWAQRAIQLDFGRSLMYERPVVELVPERAANTALLGLTALGLGTLIGLSLGTWSGSRPRAWLTRVIEGFSVVLLSAPPLLTSLVLVWIAARTGWLPFSGMRSVDASSFRAGDLAAHMVIPVLALALPIIAVFERLQASAIRETLAETFVRATASRGVPRSRIVWRDAMRPALRSVASIYGLVLASLLSGSFIVEMMTSWPGLGRLMFDALRARDVYLVAGCAAAGSVFLAGGTLLSDLASALIDPRVRE